MMMENGFTPGPWKVFCEDAHFPGIEAEGVSIVVWDDPKGERDIDASEGGVQGSSHEEALANAQLIVAAPYLLEALEAFAGWDFTGSAWEGVADDAAVLYDHKSGRSITLGQFKAATAAINRARATGGEG
jgi:hypothetical protein